MTSVQQPAGSKFHSLSVEESFDSVDSSRKGLTAGEARERLSRVGRNAIEVTPPPSPWKILVQQLRGVVVYLLAIAAVFSFLIGDTFDGVAIATVLLINTTIGFATEYRARRAMRALLALEAPRAVVLRDGNLVEVAAAELVPGDVIEVQEGAAVPADARVTDAADLRINESSLTGESAPVDKDAEPVPSGTLLPDRRDMLHAGSLVVAGSGRALVVATGRQTELGRIGTLVSDIEPERTPLERRLDILGRRLAWLALFAGAVVAAIGLLQGAATEIVVQTAIALAIAAVPEGLPAVATIALAVGVRRMARRNTLVRRLPSVETLGAVGIVCSDKTGTLTAGEMTVSALWLNGITVRVSGSGYQTNGRFTSEGGELNLDERRVLSAALRVGVLANRAALEVDSGGTHVRGDPTEAALLIAGRKFGLDRDSLLEETPEVGHVAFSSERMWMATLHRTGDDGFELALKGAPDRILAMCGRVATDHSEIELDESWRSKILGENTRFATQGMRVLGLARGRAESTDIGTPRNLVFLGLAAMIDPPAPGVSETIRTLSEAGVRTVMITGDQQPTALAVAREVGIAGPDESGMDGQQLGEPGRSRTGIAHINVFSRVSPEQKLEIITAFQAAGDVVAMLGDGVNDAAALKKADIGVAMGIRGTDVAKEVASVVLRDDRFATVGTAVEQGRIIHDNIRKFVFYLFSCNLAEVLLLIGAGLAGLPVPLTPLQILWLNIVTDTFPALALAFEPAESDVMKRPPRDPSRAILSVPFLRAVVFYGIVMTGSSGAAYVWGMAAGNPVRAGTIAFMTLALAQAFHLGNARSTGPVIRPARAFANRYALGAVLLVVSLQLASVYLAPLASILGTVPLSVTDWLIVTPLALLSGVLGQAIRLTRRWRTRRAGR